jgi:hydrogenase maturation protease
MVRSRRIIVLGLGNLIRSDDGVGIHAVQRLLKDPRIPEDVEVLDGGTLGLLLLPLVEEATHVLAIDAIHAGVAPGTILRFDISQPEPLPGTPSVHQIGFADLLAALRLLDKFPEQMSMLGVQPEETGWSERLSPAVETALPRLIEAVIGQLQKWSPQFAAAER